MDGGENVVAGDGGKAFIDGGGKALMDGGGKALIDGGGNVFWDGGGNASAEGLGRFAGPDPSRSIWQEFKTSPLQQGQTAASKSIERTSRQLVCRVQRRSAAEHLRRCTHT